MVRAYSLGVSDLFLTSSLERAGSRFPRTFCGGLFTFRGYFHPPPGSRFLAEVRYQNRRERRAITLSFSGEVFGGKRRLREGPLEFRPKCEGLVRIGKYR